MVLWVEYRNENNIPDLKEHRVYGGSASSISIKHDKHAVVGVGRIATSHGRDLGKASGGDDA